MYNFKVVFLIDRMTLWQKFMMHHAIAIEENSEQNLHIWPNLTCFFRSWLFWTLPLGWLGFGFNAIAIQPWFVTSLDSFWVDLDRHWTSSTSPERIPCDVLFVQFNFETIFAAASLLPQTSIKIPWHETNDMSTSSTFSLILIRRLSKNIFFSASMFSTVADMFGDHDDHRH